MDHLMRLLHFCFLLVSINFVESSSLISKNLIKSIKSTTPYAKSFSRKLSIGPNNIHYLSARSPIEQAPPQMPINQSAGLPKIDLKEREVVKKLMKERIPPHLLNDPDFFDEAVEEGHRTLCWRLIRSGQKVKILKDNGKNLFVKIISKDMAEVIGMLVETGLKEATDALDSVDAETGLTPFEAALKHNNTMAIYEIVSPRPSKKDK